MKKINVAFESLQSKAWSTISLDKSRLFVCYQNRRELYGPSEFRCGFSWALRLGCGQSRTRQVQGNHRHRRRLCVCGSRWHWREDDDVRKNHEHPQRIVIAPLSHTLQPRSMNDSARRKEPREAESRRENESELFPILKLKSTADQDDTSTFCQTDEIL